MVTSRKTPADWRRNLRQMMKLGAPLKTGEAAAVEKYLMRSFGPEQLSGVTREFDGRGRCVNC